MASPLVQVPAGGLSFGFVRHGTTELNQQGRRCGGDVDVDMTDAGRDGVRSLARRMVERGLSFDVIVCGTLKRTRETARILAAELGEPPIVALPEFNERRLGEWNGQPIAATEDALRRQETPPGGESEAVFEARVARALTLLVQRQDHAPLIVSSKGVGRVMHKLMGGEGRLLVDNSDLVVLRRSADPAIPLSIASPLA